jgi:short-subunit dehydrogenase
MKKTALITGGSRGLGFELSKQFASKNYDLILIARTIVDLKKSAQIISDQYSVDVKTIPADLRTISSLESINGFLHTWKVNPDVLVNNAGFGMSGYFTKLDLENQIQMINVNISALVGLTRILLPAMIEKKSGGILNVASTAAFFPGPLMSVYYATKTFVLYFSEALREEVRNYNIHVSTLCPGPTQTRFEETSGLNTNRLLKRKLFPVMSVQKVANAGFLGFQKNKRLIIPGILNRTVFLMSTIFPHAITSKVLKSLNTPS